QIEGLEVSGFEKSGIQIGSWPADGSRSGFDSVIIKNCIAYENALSGISIFGYYSLSDTLYSHQNIYISRCKAYKNDGLLGLTTHSGNGIIIGQVENAVIEYCEAYENGKNNNNPSGGPAGIWTWDSKRVTIQHSYSHHNRSQTGDGDGFDLDGGTRECILQYNYSHDNDGPGLLVAQYGGARKMKSNIVRYNISENDGKGLGALIWSGEPIGTLTAERIDFYNNTIYVDSTLNPTGNAGIAVYGNQETMQHIRVANNIVMANHHGVHIDINRANNLKFYNNVYFDFGNGYIFKDDGSSYSLLNAWRVGKNQEKYNGKSVGYALNPLLINPGKADSIAGVDSLTSILAYMFKASSTIIGKGLYIDSLLGMKNLITDYYGDTVLTKIQYTPGAFEPILPTANFINDFVCLKDTVNFYNLSQQASRSKWYFGDGDSSDIYSSIHVYTDTGWFRVSLIVWSSQSYSDTFSQRIYINPKQVVNFTVDSACERDTVSFDNLSTYTGSYTWDFGDGHTSNIFKPFHQFADTGSYQIKLKVVNQYQCVDSIDKFVYIMPYPTIQFDAKDVCVYSQVDFTNRTKNASTYH
ncbi:MAG: hypothetical protein HYZ42_17745, partial [Bacteroidetes bacterium]|nr:hypothetical protein [Bacteroidota bacterium]